MPKQPPPTQDQLRAIQQRNLDSPDTMAVLREVKRLQEVIFECYRALQLQDSGSPTAWAAGNYLLPGVLAEHSVQARLDSEWEERHIPGTRYYQYRNEPDRPDRPKQRPDRG